MTKAPDVLRIAVAQLNPTVGDIKGNLAKAREARADAARHGADLVLYCFVLITFAAIFNLHLRLRAAQETTTALARALAVATADRGPPDETA